SPPSPHLSPYYLTYSSPFFSFFNPTAPTDIYTLSLHDALPISCCNTTTSAACSLSGQACSSQTISTPGSGAPSRTLRCTCGAAGDRKSTRLNSSHVAISYAVFCLKKKKKKKQK